MPKREKSATSKALGFLIYIFVYTMLLLKKVKCKEKIRFMFSKKQKLMTCIYAAYKAKVEMVDTTCIGPFSLTNRIGERDRFLQMFPPKTTSEYKIN